MDAEFDELKREFLTEAAAKASEIEWTLRDEPRPENPTIERITYLAHQLKGAGGSYGFQAISSVAADLESTLEQMSAAGDGEMGDEVRERVRSLKAEIDRRLKEIDVRTP